MASEKKKIRDRHVKLNKEPYVVRNGAIHVYGLKLNPVVGYSSIAYSIKTVENIIVKLNG